MFIQPIDDVLARRCQASGDRRSNRLRSPQAVRRRSRRAQPGRRSARDASHNGASFKEPPDNSDQCQREKCGADRDMSGQPDHAGKTTHEHEADPQGRCEQHRRRPMDQAKAQTP